MIAAVIGLVVLTNQSYWMDEALTAYEAQLPLGAVINTVVHVVTTPPLYFVLIWLGAHQFGNGDGATASGVDAGGPVLDHRAVRAGAPGGSQRQAAHGAWRRSTSTARRTRCRSSFRGRKAEA